MSAGTSQEAALAARIVKPASTLDDETLALEKSPPSYPFPDFPPPSTRPQSSYPFPDLTSPSARYPSYSPTEFPAPTPSQFPRPKTAAPRPTRGSKPPDAFRTRSSSSLLDEFFSHPERRTVWQDTGELVRRQQVSDMDRQAVGDLVDFLRNHAPPPENFMSIADEKNADDRGRWLKLKPFASRRSKSAPKKPKSIRLPDTAVAGRTIGGHRHIAISIPIEHSPFGSNPKSQYPVYTKDDEHYTEPEPVMRYTDSNGVVTILRTVTESQESPVTDAFSSPPRKFCRPVSVTVEPLKSPISRSLSCSEPRGGHTRDYSAATLPPTPLCHFKSCHVGSTRERRCHDNNAHHGVGCEVSPIILGPHSRDTPTSATVHSNPTQQRPIARRWSVFPGEGHGPAESIDGIMYGQRRPHAKSCGTRPSISKAMSYSGRARSGTGASSRSDKTVTNVKVAKVGPMIKVNSNRDPVVDLRRILVAEQETNAGKPLDSPTLSARSSDSRQSRKEKVREKRLRDIEASRATRERRKAESDGDSLRRSSSNAPSDLSVKRSVNESAPVDPASPTSPPDGRPTLIPVIVVANVEPSSLPIGPASYLTPSSAPANSPHTPLSARSTPSHTLRGRSSTRSSQDRTSLSHHGEYHQDSLRVRSSVSPAHASPLSPVRAAYEERMLEMERRVRRLESSDDVWLKSIVPVLDNLNRTLVMIQDERRLMEDGVRARVDRTPATLPQAVREPVRRTSLNEDMLLDLTRVGTGESEDGTRVGGLESIMRELQVTSREWCPTKETDLAI